MNQLDLNDAAYISERDDQRLARTRVEPSDVLLNITGASIGRVTEFKLPRARANVNQHVCVIRPKSDLLFSGFLSRYISSPVCQAYIRRIQAGGTRQALNFSQIANFSIPLPPLEDQRRIASILDRADALRTARRLSLTKLNTLNRSAFIEMFGDPIGNDRKWRRVNVSDFVSGFESGKNVLPATDDCVGVKNRVLKVSAVTYLRFRPEEAKPVPNNYVPPQKHFVKTGDLLFSRANTAELVGATAYVFNAPTNLLLPDKIWRFAWRDRLSVDPMFVWYLFQHPSFRREIGKRATGTSGSMKNISQEKTLSISTAFPPVDKQRSFGKFARSVHRIVEQQRASEASLNALFLSIEQRVLRGDLKK